MLLGKLEHLAGECAQACAKTALYPVLTTTLVIFIYGLTAWLGGNGFLAVYLAGIVMGNGVFVHRRSLTRYHDGLAWLMQIAMFLVLGLQVFLPPAGDCTRRPAHRRFPDAGCPPGQRLPPPCTRSASTCAKSG